MESNGNIGGVDYAELIKRLKSLKDRVLSQPKPAWSEKSIADVFEMAGLAKIVREQENDALTEALQSAMIELAKYSVVPQIRQEWSEESENAMMDVIECLKEYRNCCVLTKEHNARIERGISALKAIRYLYRWKPTARQLDVLKSAIDELDVYDDSLVELYEDLKKL